jgi:hypothetical protein
MKDRNIQCLSKIYVNCRTNMEWKCFSCGKIWWNSWISIRHNHDCKNRISNKPWNNERIDKYLVDNLIEIRRLSNYDGIKNIE